MLHYKSHIELLIIIIQFICYVNSYIVLTIKTGERSFISIVLITLLNANAFKAFYYANQTHQNLSNESLKSNLSKKQIKTRQSKYKDAQKQQYNRNEGCYCRSCKTYILYRDHHCLFVGRCIEKKNYQFYLSYLAYSYTLSILTILSVLLQYQFIIVAIQNYIHFKLELTILFFGVASATYFVIFTASLLITSFRSITIGVYTVEEMKGLKQNKFPYSKWQCARIFLGLEAGRRWVYEQFKKNWKIMVGENISFWNIIFVN